MRSSDKIIVRNAAAIKTLARANKNVQKALLSQASKEFINSLIAIINIILKGKISLTRAQLNGLRPYEQKLRKLVSSKTPLKQKRQLVCGSGQDGGVFAALGKIIPIALNVLSALGK